MSAESRNTPDVDTITVGESDGWCVARDGETGVASQGRTKAGALSNLAEALELHAEDAVRASGNWGFARVGRRGSHGKLRYVHPDTDER